MYIQIILCSESFYPCHIHHHTPTFTHATFITTPLPLPMPHSSPHPYLYPCHIHHHTPTFTHATFITTPLPFLQMRRLLRHHFQASETAKRVYDVATWATSHTMLNYGAMCFLLLSAEKCFKLWRYMAWHHMRSHDLPSSMGLHDSVHT